MSEKETPGAETPADAQDEMIPQDAPEQETPEAPEAEVSEEEVPEAEETPAPEEEPPAPETEKTSGQAKPAKKDKEKKPLIRRIIGFVGYTVVIAMMVLVAFILFSNMSGKVTFIFGRTAMWVKTRSMEPEIPEKSYILVRKAAASEVKIDDVIVFKSDDPSIAGAYNTHRVIDVTENGEFVTKGDNNPVKDIYTAKPANVLGIYEKQLPVMTAFGRVLSTTRGIMITFTMIFVIFIIIYIPDMTRASKRRAEEAERIEKERMDALVALEVEKLKAADAAKKAQAAAKAEETDSRSPETEPPDAEAE